VQRSLLVMNPYYRQHRTRPRKKRENGAPTVQDRERKRMVRGWATRLGMNPYYRQHRTRPRKKRENGAPTFLERETKTSVKGAGHPPPAGDIQGSFSSGA
jgi:hypothetical protein